MKTHLVLIATGGLAALALGPLSIQLIGLFVVLFAIFQMARDLGSERNWKAIQGALSDYEEIVGGQLWVGNEAEILASDRVDNKREPGPIAYEHICRTKNGAWFLFRVYVTHGRILDRSLLPCDEAMAKSRLQRHRDAYVRCFGQPASA